MATSKANGAEDTQFRPHVTDSVCGRICAREGGGDRGARPGALRVSMPEVGPPLGEVIDIGRNGSVVSRNAQMIPAQGLDAQNQHVRPVDRHGGGRAAGQEREQR